MGIGNFFRRLLNIQPKVYERIPIDEEAIEQNKTLAEALKKVQSQSAQLDKISAEKNLKKLREQEKDKDQEKILELLIQKRQLDEDMFKGTISLRKVLKKLEEKRYKNKVDITDKDDKVIFGKFNDFLILPNGYFGIQDTDGRVLSYGKTTRHIIHKPESFANQIRRRHIRLPCNENYVFFPDIEETELPESTYNEETGKIKWARVNEKPFKKIVENFHKRLADDEAYIEKIEQDKVDFVNDNRDLKRALRVQKNIAETSQTELSKAMDKSIQFEQAIGGLQMKVVELQEIKNINDRLISGLEKINKILLEQAEELGSSTPFKKALNQTQTLLEWSKNNIGETIINETKEKDTEVQKVISNA